MLLYCAWQAHSFSHVLFVAMLQQDFTVRVQSKSALTTSDVKVTNGQVMSVTAVSGSSGSYDVAVAAKSKSGTVAVSTIASAAVAASTITVDVDTTAPEVMVILHCHHMSCVRLVHLTHSQRRTSVASCFVRFVSLAMGCCTSEDSCFT